MNYGRNTPGAVAGCSDLKSIPSGEEDVSGMEPKYGSVDEPPLSRESEKNMG